MEHVVVRSTKADKAIANAIAGRTTPGLEQAARLLTWGADEKVVLALAISGWLCARRQPAFRPITDHLLAVSVLAA
ncbi:MAG: phosphatase PAP2 family protein, partial [Bradyrhizobium sp.]